MRNQKDISEEEIMKALQDYASGLNSDHPQANAATTNQNNRGSGGSRGGRGGRGGKSDAKSGNSNSNSNSGNSSSSDRVVCKKCGARHKSDQECYAINDTCGKCGKKGHHSQNHDAWLSAQKSNDSDKSKKETPNIIINCITTDKTAGDLIVDLQRHVKSPLSTWKDNTPALPSESSFDADLVGETNITSLGAQAPVEDMEDLKSPPIRPTTNVNHVGITNLHRFPPTKICIDSGTTAHLISNREFIQKYYEDYSVYQTGSGEELPSYGKGTLDLPMDNGSLTLVDVFYAPDLGFKLLSTILLGNKGVEVYLRETSVASQILYKDEVLGYADPIENQYVVRLKSTPISNAAAAQISPTPKAIPYKIWHERMAHLGYRNLAKLKNCNGMA